MAQILVRKLEDSVKSRLRERARRHGRSLEEEVRVILREATDEANSESRQVGLGTQLSQLFSDLDFDFEIPELRGEEVRPAELGNDDP